MDIRHFWNWRARRKAHAFAWNSVVYAELTREDASVREYMARLEALEDAYTAFLEGMK